MKIKEIYDNIETFSDEERKLYISKLMDKSCELSKNQLFNFQIKWDKNK